MFASKANTPLNLNNVLNRVIPPALNRCEVCRKERSERSGNQPSPLGVNDKIIQAMLRHQN